MIQDCPPSPRELQVLQLIAYGHSTEQIAAELFLSPLTVRSYVKALLFRLSAHDRAHAVGIGYQRGLLLLPVEEVAS